MQNTGQTARPPMYHALVVEYNQAVAELVQERLESIGHTCDSAETQDEARRLLGKGSYAYVILDLEIPVRHGRVARIDNGKNFLREIRRTKGYEDVPIVVMTVDGQDSYRLSREVLRLGGADDFIAKPFSDGDQILEKAITDVLRSRGRSRPGAKSHSKLARDPKPPQPFEQGDLAFYPSRVELCSVKICGDDTSGVIRRILDVLRSENARGRRRAYSGEELAAMIGNDGGPTAVAGAIRNFRKRVKRTMLTQANVAIEPSTDLLVNDRQHGYRFPDMITVVEREDLLEADQEEASDDVPKRRKTPCSLPSETDENSRVSWILTQLKKTGGIRKRQIIQRTGCSDSTARRTLAKLREDGKIVFEGSARSGCWRLV